MNEMEFEADGFGVVKEKQKQKEKKRVGTQATLTGAQGVDGMIGECSDELFPRTAERASLLPLSRVEQGPHVGGEGETRVF